jgi:3-oxoacyl-[acyl-carrier protein] reductase
MRLKELRGLTAVVTGASSGLGRATALALADEGMRVVVTARREERLRALVAEIEAAGGEAAFFAGDAALEATAEAVVGLASERFGAVEVLVNNAGMGNYKKLVDTSVAEYDELMGANVRSSFLLSRAVAPGMIAQRSGTMVFVSSVAGLAGAANEAVYSATKFAQVGFAQSLGEELRGYGIKVCAFCPGGIKSEFAVGRGRTAQGVAGSRMMEPEEVAAAIVFACQQPANVRVTQMTVRHMGEPFA